MNQRNANPSFQKRPGSASMKPAKQDFSPNSRRCVPPTRLKMMGILMNIADRVCYRALYATFICVLHSDLPQRP
jgi:hypothetical protein